jgi:hypothetical protein
MHRGTTAKGLSARRAESEEADGIPNDVLDVCHAAWEGDVALECDFDVLEGSKVDRVEDLIGFAPLE